MKRISENDVPLKIGIAIILLVILVICGFWPAHKAQATFFPTANEASTINATLLSVTTSNVTGPAIYVEGVNQHTLQINTLSTNSATNIIQGSLDNIAWVPLATNSPSTSVTNAVTINQRWSYIRATFGLVGTGQCSIVYLGGKN